MSFTRLWLNHSVKNQPVGGLMDHYSQCQIKDAHIISKFVGTAYCIAFAILFAQKSVSNDDRPVTTLWYLHPSPSIISFQTQ